MAKKKPIQTPEVKVEDALIRGLREAAESEQRHIAAQQKIIHKEQYAERMFQQERQEQIKQFKKNIKGAKVYVWDK